MKLAATTSIAVGAGMAVADAIQLQLPASSGAVGQPFDGYVSYSIEFSSFPEFAGNASNPNLFSYNLINNLGKVMGTNPYIRVGGNTQDYALYDANQKEALIGIYNISRSPDYPTTITIGKAYFESYRTWPGVKLSHGFNLGLGATKPEGWDTLQQTAPIACEALSHDNLYTWEYGNEPDLFSTSAQGPVRPKDWNEATYVEQWQNGTNKIRELVQKTCPKLAPPTFMAPSFAGAGNHLKGPKTFQAGLDDNDDVALFSTHNYISGAGSPGVTLQGTLMNHTRTMASVNGHVDEYNQIRAITGDKTPPLMFGECNSLYNQGRPGLSNTFGAALWGIDFNLYSASVGFKRVHMHMGTNYRYQAWQPVETDLASIGTKAPYYGSMAVAAMLRNSASHPVSIGTLALPNDAESGYTAHFTTGSKAGKLARVMIINMRGYNSTVDGAGLDPLPKPPTRQVRTYSFQVHDAAAEGQVVQIQRLLANGSDAITGITYDGWSYNRELDMGKPVRLHNVTIGETTTVKNGWVTVDVVDSSAALLSFTKKCT